MKGRPGMRLSRTFFLLLFAVFLVVCGPAPELAARAGGGHSSGGRSGGSSGGSRSSSSSSSRSSSSSSSSSSRSYGGSRGSGSSGNYNGSTSPGGFVALVVIGLVVIVFLYVKSRFNETRRMDFAPGPARPPRPREDRLRQLRNTDPNFSPILFKAFAYLVYVKYHEWAGSRGQSAAVLPYLMPQAKAQGANGPAVSGVLVEALEIENAYVTAEHAIIDVKFQATLMLAEKGPRSRILRDDGVRFIRSVKARTPAPEEVLRLGCPQCGSPEEPQADGKCPACGTVNARGEVSWVIADVQGQVLNFKPEQLG